MNRLMHAKKSPMEESLHGDEQLVPRYTCLAKHRYSVPEPRGSFRFLDSLRDDRTGTHRHRGLFTELSSAQWGWRFSYYDRFNMAPAGFEARDFDVEDQDFFRYSGIFRDVFLLARDHVHVRDACARTALDAAYRDAEVDLSVIFVGGKPDSAQTSFYDPDGALISTLPLTMRRFHRRGNTSRRARSAGKSRPPSRENYCFRLPPAMLEISRWSWLFTLLSCKKAHRGNLRWAMFGSLVLREPASDFENSTAHQGTLQ